MYLELLYSLLVGPGSTVLIKKTQKTQHELPTRCPEVQYSTGSEHLFFNIMGKKGFVGFSTGTFQYLYSILQNGT